MFECKICDTLNHSARTHCKVCGTIPREYSMIGREAQMTEDGSLLPIGAAFGSRSFHNFIGSANTRTLKTVSLDYYADSGE